MTEKLLKDKRKLLALYVLLCLICGVVGWGVGVLLFSVAIGKTKKELKRIKTGT